MFCFWHVRWPWLPVHRPVRHRDKLFAIETSCSPIQWNIRNEKFSSWQEHHVIPLVFDVDVTIVVIFVDVVIVLIFCVDVVIALVFYKHIIVIDVTIVVVFVDVIIVLVFYVDVVLVPSSIRTMVSDYGDGVRVE